MQVLQVTAPIPMDELKKYFSNKDTFFVVDYERSNLKGSKLLTYLSNLDLPVDVIKFDEELMSEYLKSSSLVSIPTLERVTIDLLLEFKGISGSKIFGEFIDANREIIELWSLKLDSLTLFNLYTIEDESLKSYAKSFTENPTCSLVGVNFLSLLKHEEFFVWYKSIDESKLNYFSKYFNDYMFRGKNLFSFWANENNPMFLLTYGIASGEVNAEEFVKSKKETESEL